LDGGPQRLAVDRPSESAGEANRYLLERHHLQTMPRITGCP
jgi:hypothetical protein